MLVDSAVVGRIFKANAAPVGMALDVAFIFPNEKKDPRRPTATPRAARLPWQRSLKADGGSDGPDHWALPPRAQPPLKKQRP